MKKSTARRRGICLVVAAPSGAGKSTITRALLASDAALSLSVSVTTRVARPGEIDGVHYYFQSDAAFSAMASAGSLQLMPTATTCGQLEHARVFGHAYGTPRAPVEESLARGQDVLFDIDWQGWRQVKAALPCDSVGLFILPPSLEALRTRLSGRATDSEEAIAGRMRQAVDEISHWDEFDHVLINDDLAHCIEEARAVLHAARCTVARSLGARDLVAGLGR